MVESQDLRRPIGWWLKEADARLDAAFDTALADHGVDRRGWQVLASLARSSAARAEIVATLAPFDEPAVINRVVDDLQRHGWVADSDGQLQLTSEGVRKQGSLAPLVDGVRRQVANALPEDDYATLIGLLARLVAALAPASTKSERSPRVATSEQTPQSTSITKSPREVH